MNLTGNVLINLEGLLISLILFIHIARQKLKNKYDMIHLY